MTFTWWPRLVSALNLFGGEKGNTYTTKLLPKHDDPASKGGPANTGDGEELAELREQVLAGIGLALQLDTDPCVVGVTGGLHVVPTETLEGAVRFVGLVVLDVPSVMMEEMLVSLYDQREWLLGREKGTCGRGWLQVIALGLTDLGLSGQK